MVAKKKTAPPARPVRTPKKPAGTGLGLKISPDQADGAIQLLSQYVNERAEVATQKDKLGDLEKAVKLMDALYKFKEKIAELVKSPAEKAYDALRFTIVPSFMEDSDIRTITYEGIGRVNAQDDIQVAVLSQPDMQQWLRDEDLEDLIKPTVNAQTLAASLRARLKDGKTMPPEDVVKITPIVRAQITRSA